MRSVILTIKKTVFISCHTLDNTIWISLCIVHQIELGGILLLFSAGILIGQYILLRLSKGILVEQYILLRLSDDILFGVLDGLLG